MAATKREAKGKCSFLDQQNRVPTYWNTTHKDDYVYRYKNIQKKSRLFNKEPGEGRKLVQPMGSHSQPQLKSLDASDLDCRNFDSGYQRLCLTDGSGELKNEFSKVKGDKMFHQCPVSDEFKQANKVYYCNKLPKWERPELPGDILQPHPIALQAKQWKGVKIPFEDSRFEPLFLCDRDTDFMTCNLDPFRYFHRKKKFPEKNRCPYLPIPREAYLHPDPLGNFSSVRHTTLSDRRLSRKRFPRPPESFITKLW